MDNIDKLTELAQKIMQVDSTERRYKAAGNLQQKIVEDTGSVISACTDLVRENATLRLNGMRDILWMYHDVAHKCIYLLTKYLGDIEEYEQDTEEKRAERKQKLKKYQQITSIQSPSQKVIHDVRNGRTKVIGDAHPDLIYCQHGTYREYSEICNTFEYRLCRKIQKSGGGDLKTLFQKVCLYIALKNERAMMKEELLLLGVDVLDDEETTEVKPHYSNDNKGFATKQFYSLIERGYLPSDTPLNDWLYIYGVNGIEPNTSPLKWQKAQTELGYLVQNIWGDTDKQRLWVVCQAVFTIKGGKPNIGTIKPRLSAIENGYRNKPKSFNALDDTLRIG